MAKRTDSRSRKRVENLISRYAASWQEWNDAVAGLPDTAYDEPSISKQWNLKDVVGHLLAYQLLMVRHLNSIKKRGWLSSPRAPSYSYFNRREAARYRKIPLEQLWIQLEDARLKLIPRIEKLTDADLSKIYKSAWTNSNYKASLASILREEATHIAAHAREVKRWREKYGM
ncbi:MAG TPA: DinB family protein [Anaerolineae bacterium]|nr:DinB family protein [Anaerolineae bacterium]